MGPDEDGEDVGRVARIVDLHRRGLKDRALSDRSILCTAGAEIAPTDASIR
jgi:hypothetical protein